MSDLLNKASLVMIPSGYKEDTVYSVVPSDGSGDLSFTRASNGTRVNSAGLVEVCPWNLFQSSETFNLSPWATNAGATITNTNQIAPNGTTTADILSASTNASSGIYQVVTGNVVGQVYTASLYVKNNSGATSIKYQEENCSAGILFNSVTGAITGTYGTVVSSSVENAGNGWYKIQFAYTSTNATNIFVIYSMLTSANSFVLWGAELNIGSTAKPYFPTTDRLNVPRLTYQNGGGGCPSLLLEKQSTNSQTYSEQIDNAVWGLANLSVSANNTTSPDGTQNADKIVEDTANARHEFYGVSLAFNGSNAVSFYAKNAGRRYICALEPTGAGGATFDLQNGVVSAVTAVSASIENVGNGWYRCSVIISKTATTQIYYCLRTTGGVGIETYTGDGTSGVYFWGAQTELNSSYATSYISTQGSSATRVADACFKTGISSLIGQTEGTIFFDGYFGNEPDELYVFLQKSGSGGVDDSIYLQRYLSGIYLNVYFGSTTQALIGGGSFVAGQRIKIAAAYKANDFVIYINGGQISFDTSGTPPTCANLQIGTYTGAPSTAIYMTSKPINEVVLFKTRLTNAELASLTTI
jgi:hypothetical protein